MLITPADNCGECPYWANAEQTELCEGVVRHWCEWQQRFLPSDHVCDYFFDPEDEPSMAPQVVDDETALAVVRTLAELGFIRLN